MIKSKQLVGMPVISLAEGQQIGRVKELVINPDSKSIAALVIEQRGWFKEQKFIPYGKVHSVGSDAITIDQSSNVQKGSGLPDIVKLTKDKHGVIQAKVVAENGKLLGVVEEFYLDTDKGAIVGLELSGSFIDGLISGRAFLDMAFVQTIGRELLIAGNDAADNLIKVDGGLSETMKTIKDTGSSLWESTLVKTKEVTGSINKKLEQFKKQGKTSDEPCSCGHHHSENITPHDSPGVKDAQSPDDKQQGEADRPSNDRINKSD
ncbi:PRC-barrel domain-containing protein [Desulfofalx alkaliphila]|uniref:PRC-barrel domain-containing protein n=1 Tax=Desulfofalx alkaliphila TaxID=105483 RepID=UPI00068ED85D|nr:PRC-barrel domain-containing protein [Desulfofalx alkaliphila]